MSLVQPCQDGGKDKGKKENDPKKLHKNGEPRLESLDRQNFKYVSHPQSVSIRNVQKPEQFLIRTFSGHWDPDPSPVSRSGSGNLTKRSEHEESAGLFS